MLPEVNLLPKYERSESVVYNFFIAGLILIVLLAAVLGYFYFSKNSAVEDTAARVNALEEEKLILETRLATLETESDGSLHAGAVAYVENYRLPTSVLVDEFIDLLPANAYLSTYHFDYHTVSVQTQFETIPASSDYIADLNETDFLREVVVEEVMSFSSEDMSGDNDNLGVFDEQYDDRLRYDVRYSMQVDHQSLAGEEENDETAISGE